MALKGDLASVDLAQVFQMLAMNQKVGLLSIQAPRAWRALYFDHRGVTLYYNEHTLLDRVLSAMVITGVLGEDAVRDARDHAATTGSTVVDSLLAGGYLSEGQLVDAFRHGMEEEVYDLFFWRDARFEFFEGASSFEGHEGVVNEQFFFSTDGLIMEAARRIDEWSYIRERVTGPLEVFQRTGTNPFDLDEDVAAVLDLADGKRNVARMVEITAMPSFHVYKALAVLFDAGHVAPVEASALLSNAQECMAEGRLQDAINLYEKALSVGEGAPAAHTMVARAYEAIEEYELAVYHLTCEAEFHAASGNAKDAVPLLIHTTNLLPTDLTARERLVELTIGRSDLKIPDFDPVKAGKALVDIYLEIGEIERVRAILERLVRQNPSDVELKKALINVHSKAGDTKRVIELYESIASDLAAQHRPIEAIKYLQKILMLDRTRKDVSDRIRALYEMDERNRTRRRSLVAVGALFAVSVVLAGLWYLYERHAREHYERIDVTEYLASKNFVGATSVYKSFLDSYPLTIVGQEAEAELVRIQGLQAAYEADLEAKRREQVRDLKRRRATYQIEWTRYRTEFDAHNLDGALEALESVRRMVSDCGEEEDRLWSEQVQLEKSYRELRAYLSEAAALARSARQKLRAGDWQAGRQDLLELQRDYGMAQSARGIRLPVLIDSRPPGAELWLGGSRVMVESDGARVPAKTPVVVSGLAAVPEDYELRLEGFETLRVRVDAMQSERLAFTLSAVPVGRYAFESPVLTTPGIGPSSGVLAAGLRGGKVGLAWTRRAGHSELLINLPGLSEVVGAPVVVGDRVLFRTNESYLACHDLRDGSNMWRVRLEYPAAHDPIVQDGRLFLGDSFGRLFCLSVQSGRQMWMRALDDVLAGPPVLVNRFVRVASRSGTIYRLDANDGRSDEARCWRFANQISTPVLVVSGGVLVFGSVDGGLHAMYEDSGRIAWTAMIGRAIREDEIVLAADDSVLVVGPEETLIKVGLRDGREVARSKLPGERRSGPVVREGHVYVVVNEKRGRNEAGDLLVAFDIGSLEPAWEYRDPKSFQGAICADERAGVFVSGSDGVVLRFR